MMSRVKVLCLEHNLAFNSKQPEQQFSTLKSLCYDRKLETKSAGFA